VQRDPVAFAVDDDRAKAVRADRLRRLDDAPAKPDRCTASCIRPFAFR
jgi:hypothetical protein